MSIDKYKNSGSLIYLPTIEACEYFKINRLPKNYSGSANGSNKTILNNGAVPSFGDTSAPFPALPTTGPQFSTFNSTDYMESLKNLSVPSVNTRDIIVEVLSNKPYTIKTKTENGITTSEYEYGKDGNTPVYRLSISPTNPNGDPFEMEISHEHDWGTQSDIFSSILRGAAQLVGQADDFIQKIKNVGNATGNAQDGFKQLPNRRFDLAETYSSTKKQTIDIPFTLFTPGGTGPNGEETFIRDILDPITLITSFSYPKRSNQLGEGLTGELADVVAKKSQTATPDEKKLNSLDLVNSLNPGFRVFVSDPPAYVNVYHQGGLFSYKNCYIQKFTYKFKNFVDGDTGDIKDIVSDDGVAGVLKAISSNAGLAYPVVAECVLTITTTEPLFSDDFIALASDRSKASFDTGGLTKVKTVPANPNTGK